jgi:hypothetical protein
MKMVATRTPRCGDENIFFHGSKIGRTFSLPVLCPKNITAKDP